MAALARETRRLYHDRSTAQLIADRLLALVSSDLLAAAQTPDALAGLLNAEIAAASRDSHFMVMAGAMHAPPVPPTPPHAPVPPLTTAELAHLRRVNFGLAAAELLSGNVGRLDIRQFYRPAAEVRARLASAMALLADSWGMIVDLRRNPGGDPHAVALLLSYFFDRHPFIVNRFHWRDRPIEEFRTTSDPGGDRYGETRPLVVLVSGATWSAAEEFAYDVQALRRGIVVGQVTGGGANHALPVAIAGGLTAFIPQARAENPVTRSNWEGRGVQPDVSATPSEQIRIAHRLALQRIADDGDADKLPLIREALSSL